MGNHKDQERALEKPNSMKIEKKWVSLAWERQRSGSQIQKNTWSSNSTIMQISCGYTCNSAIYLGMMAKILFIIQSPQHTDLVAGGTLVWWFWISFSFVLKEILSEEGGWLIKSERAFLLFAFAIQIIITLWKFMDHWH